MTILQVLAAILAALLLLVLRRRGHYHAGEEGHLQRPLAPGDERQRHDRGRRGEPQRVGEVESRALEGERGGDQGRGREEGEERPEGGVAQSQARCLRLRNDAGRLSASASAVTAARIQNEACMVATSRSGSAPTGSWPRLREISAPTISMPLTMPSERAPALRAEAMPARSGGTAFMTIVMLGEEKNAKPRPCTARTRPTWRRCEPPPSPRAISAAISARATPQLAMSAAR